MIYVYGGTYQEFRQWAQCRNINPNNQRSVVYIKDAHTLRGRNIYEDDTIWSLGLSPHAHSEEVNRYHQISEQIEMCQRRTPHGITRTYSYSELMVMNPDDYAEFRHNHEIIAVDPSRNLVQFRFLPQPRCLYCDEPHTSGFHEQVNNVQIRINEMIGRIYRPLTLGNERIVYGRAEDTEMATEELNRGAATPTDYAAFRDYFELNESPTQAPREDDNWSYGDAHTYRDDVDLDELGKSYGYADLEPVDSLLE